MTEENKIIALSNIGRVLEDIQTEFIDQLGKATSNEMSAPSVTIYSVMAGIVQIRFDWKWAGERYGGIFNLPLNNSRSPMFYKNHYQEIIDKMCRKIIDEVCRKIAEDFRRKTSNVKNTD
jgi:hypothetical protein